MREQPFYFVLLLIVILVNILNNFDVRGFFLGLKLSGKQITPKNEHFVITQWHMGLMPIYYVSNWSCCIRCYANIVSSFCCFHKYIYNNITIFPNPTACTRQDNLTGNKLSIRINEVDTDESEHYSTLLSVLWLNSSCKYIVTYPNIHLYNFNANTPVVTRAQCAQG